MARSSPLWRHYGGRVIKRAGEGRRGHCIISRALPAYAKWAHACTIAFFLAHSRKARAEVSNWPWSVRLFLFFFFLSRNRLKFERNCDCSEGYTFKVRNIYIFFLLFPIADYSQLGWKNRRGPIYLQRIRIPSRKRELIFIRWGRGMLIWQAIQDESFENDRGTGVRTKSRTDQPRSRSQPLLP